MINFMEVTKRYCRQEKTRLVLDRVTFNVPSGEMAAVTGPSGSGKSTLLNLAGALDLPDSGIVTIAGTEISSSPEDERTAFRNSRLGFVFQHHFLIPELSVWENAAYSGAIKNKGFDSALRQKAVEILATLEIDELADEFPQKLSGGEAQRVAVARAIFNAPDLVIMDEPTGSLDSINKKNLIRLISGLNRASGITFLIATHDAAVRDICPMKFELRDCGCARMAI